MTIEMVEEINRMIMISLENQEINLIETIDNLQVRKMVGDTKSGTIKKNEEVLEKEETTVMILKKKSHERLR